MLSLEREQRVSMRAICILIFLVLLLNEIQLADAVTRAKQRRIELSSVKCNETGNTLSDVQRGHIIYLVNKFRSIVNDGKRRLKRADLTRSNYRKVRYSCVFEEELTFECNDDLRSENFISDEYTWRRVKKTSEQIMDSFNTSMQNAYNEKDTLRMALSPDVTEIGCFDKICSGFEYIACKTGHAIVVSTNTPLRTPNSRCKKDADCTLPGYTRCDTALGLCDLDPPDKKVVPPLVCLSLTSPLVPLIKEKCDRVDDTGSEMSGAERESTVNSINSFRAMINNNCTLGLGVPKPAMNYRKVKYSCALENNAKFECSTNFTPETFISDDNTWRSATPKINNNASRHALLHHGAPIASQFLIDPETASVGNGNRNAVFVKLFMSEDVTEVGCFVKVCGENEYIVCKSNHDSNVPSDAPLYTPGQRCNVDADCTLPGYHICDANVGLCDYKSHYARRMETYDKCADMQNVYIERVAEKCQGYDTGSDIGNLERYVYVYFVNQFRSLINKNCDLGKGNVKPITNYRKVKYSCALEERAKFSCPKNLSDFPSLYYGKKSNKSGSEFESDRFTLTFYSKVQPLFRQASFIYWSPYNHDMLLDPTNQTVGANGKTKRYVHFMMSPDVTEFGCFIKVCGDYEYMACKTGHVVWAPEEKPLYTPGKRCMADGDCTLPGYTRCDAALGLCDLDPPENKVGASLKEPFVCLSVTSSRMPLVKEKCDDVHDTGSEFSVAERESIVESINKLRAMINNNCTLGLGVPKPASNYRKVKYSCDLEIKSKFECSQTNPFNNDKETWRHWASVKNSSYLRRALFHLGAPIARQLLINPETATVDNDPGNAVFMKLFMSEDVTEVGCFLKVCGGYECIACKTNHNHSQPYDSPLYTPGQRCNVNADCRLPGYTTCDASVGLCDYKNHQEIKTEARSRKCADIRSVHIEQKTEQCSLGYNTESEISNTERDLIAHTVNYFRQRINNNCDFGKGIVKHITNYRKVKYSCAFEEDAKFECADVNSDNFKSDNYTLRQIRSKPGFFRIAIFESFSPWKDYMLIDPDDQTIGTTGLWKIYAQMMLSPEVTEIGCFVKVCNESEYLACTTGHTISTPDHEPLYKPGNRCIANEDCTLPGYRICDIESGLCETD